MTVNKDEIRAAAEEARNMRGEYIDAQEYARDVLTLLAKLDSKDAEIARLQERAVSFAERALDLRNKYQMSEEARKAAERERDLLKESLTAVVEENRIERTKRQEWVDSVEKEARQYLKERDELRQQNAELRFVLEWYASDERALLARQTLSEVKDNG